MPIKELETPCANTIMDFIVAGGVYYKRCRPALSHTITVESIRLQHLQRELNFMYVDYYLYIYMWIKFDLLASIRVAFPLCKHTWGSNSYSGKVDQTWFNHWVRMAPWFNHHAEDIITSTCM